MDTAKKIFITRVNVPFINVKEDYSKKLPNFQLIRPLSVEQQIERFTSAGKNLMDLQGLGVFDFDVTQPLDDTLEDPTRDPDYDMIDAATTMRDMQLKYQGQSAKADGTETQSEGSSSSAESKNDSSTERQVEEQSATKDDPSASVKA